MIKISTLADFSIALPNNVNTKEYITKKLKKNEPKCTLDVLLNCSKPYTSFNRNVCDASGLFTLIIQVDEECKELNDYVSKVFPILQRYVYCVSSTQVQRIEYHEGYEGLTHISNFLKK